MEVIGLLVFAGLLWFFLSPSSPRRRRTWKARPGTVSHPDYSRIKVPKGAERRPPSAPRPAELVRSADDGMLTGVVVGAVVASALSSDKAEAAPAKPDDSFSGGGGASAHYDPPAPSPDTGGGSTGGFGD